MSSFSELAPLNVEGCRSILTLNGISIEERQWNLLCYWALRLQTINQEVNLVSRKDIDWLWEHHILHCLSLLAIRSLSDHQTICDFGTGGGFPGIPLAIVRPDLAVTLLDSKVKKIKVLQQMIQELGLPNVFPIAGRGEELGRQPAYAQRFPVIVCRAVASLKQLVQWTQHLRSPSSVMHVYKGGDLREELRAIQDSRGLKQTDVSIVKLEGYDQFVQDEKKIVTLYFEE